MDLETTGFDSPRSWPNNSLFAQAKQDTAETAGIGWEAALAQAEAFLANLTLEEKAGMVTGD